MANGIKILAIVLIVFGLIFGGGGAFMMFSYVPGLLDAAEVPDDLDKHYYYGGWVSKLNTGTGSMDNIEFTADRHVTYDGKADGGHIYIRSAISAEDNDTGADIPDLYSDTVYEVHPKKLTLYNVDIQGGSKEGYDRDIAESEGVNYVFPIPAEEEDYQIWSSDILHWSTAVYLGKEDRGGVECYVYRGEVGDLDDPEDRGWEVPLAPSLAALLGPFANDTKMYLKGWEKAWVHPTTGGIVDYAKELRQYLYLPDLPDIPDIVYPSDLMSTSGFSGSLTLFDQTTGTFIPIDGIKAERILEVTSSNGDVLTADDTTTVYGPDGSTIDLLSSAVQVMFNATDGMNEGMGRTGHFLFPPTGVEMKDYMIWDDGFGKELTAEYMGNRTIGDFLTYEYKIDVHNETYLAGGITTMEMTYWVEVTTGIVMDAEKHVTNWRPQPARRLPVDTSMINKTIHMNATVTLKNPLGGDPETMEIVVEQMINCSGYTDATFAVAKVQETVTKLYMGTPMGAPSVAKFGVNAVTMEYVYVDGWSTMNRTGLFTFPVGLLNETGELPEQFIMYYSDLGTPAPAVLTAETDFQGLAAAVYTMEFVDVALTYPELVAALSGEDPGIPGATGLYDATMTYTVDIDTGTVLNVERTSSVSIVPPTYEYLWDTLESTTVLTGTLKNLIGDTNLTITQTLTGDEGGAGTTQMTINRTVKLDDGSDFLPPDESVILYNTLTHEMVYPNGTGMGLYFLFPPNPTEAAYPMANTIAGMQILGNAVKGDETGTTVDYNWTGITQVDGSLLNPLLTGVEFNLTIMYNYLVDKATGMALDISLDLMLQNGSMPQYDTAGTFEAEDDPMLPLKVGLMGWALLAQPAEVLTVGMELYDMEVAYNTAKAVVTQGLLKVADGVEPALVLDLSMNETTRAEMLLKVQETLALLEQLEGLKSLHQFNDLLAFSGHQIALVYYKQLDEDPEGAEESGSVEYHGSEAKKVDDTISMYGTTIPIILYVVMIVLVLVGIALILAGPKEAPPEEEEEDEEPPEEEEGEGEE
ncbi:MAG: porin PorA family protein [Thermoplasmatota archaeon]